MKRQAVSLVSLLSLLLVTGSAIAQTSNLRANVPFNFTAGEKTLSAGAYTIGAISGAPQILLLQAQDGATRMMVASNAAENHKPANKTKLVFNRYRDQYFLAEIWEEGAARGRQLQKSNREKELAKELASDLTGQQVEVVASLY